MKSLFEEFGGTYTLGKDGMYYPNLMIEETDQRSIGKWGRMHREYLKEQHPRLYQRLILNGTMGRHLAYADGRATAMLESLITQMVKQEGVTEQLKAEQPMVWVGRMNSIRSRAEEIVMEEVINTL
ncbi:MAG: TnpV protein [Clostridia bacterium]|nr:TnpV protein [Oscillospiraceae bacterium]MBQ4453462.1 TnpV protein [Clostridia bacterium]MBQ9252124.1 TnpV protein [Clostridia bacterium]